MRYAMIKLIPFLIIAMARSAVSSAAPAVYLCDNDRVSSDYPHCNNSILPEDEKNHRWKQRTGQGGDVNGDDRLGNSQAKGLYNWKFFNVSAANTLRVRVWLNNVDFTDPDAVYYVIADRLGLPIPKAVNQNTAPGGWWTLGSNFPLGRSNPVVQLNPPSSSQSSVHAGADIVELATSQQSTGPAAVPDTLEGVGAGPSVADDGIEYAASCGVSHTGDARIAAVQQRMLNAIDHYRNVKGKYRVVFRNNAQDDAVEFEVSEDAAAPGSQVTTSSRLGGMVEHRSDGRTSAVLDSARRVVRLDEVAVTPGPVGTRHYHNAACEPVFVPRQDPADGHAASDVAFPQIYAFWLADSEARIAGRDTVAGRPATVIEGRHDPYLEAKLGAASFKMWIDEDTGVLLRLLGIDARGAVVYFIEVDDIQFDRGVDAGHFAVSLR